MGTLAMLRKFWQPSRQGAKTLEITVPKSRKKGLLTFFHADFGKEFPSRNLWRGPSRNCPSPSSALCVLLYRTEHFSRAGRGVARKGGKKEKRTRENRSVCAYQCANYPCGNYPSTSARNSLGICLEFARKTVRTSHARKSPTPIMSFSRFSSSDLCRGPLGDYVVTWERAAWGNFPPFQRNTLRCVPLDRKLLYN